LEARLFTGTNPFKPKQLTKPVRKFSAILLISLFAFSQYARQLGYLECKFSNTFKTGALKCDCDKKAGLAKQDNNQLPFSKIHTHIHPDEFFSAARELAIGSSFIFLKKTCNQLHNVDECKGSYTKPWQPPNASVNIRSLLCANRLTDIV
jgi:hypothetical protein